MKIKGSVYCFFEQSGAFKNEFIKLGIPAKDYDIENQFGETDVCINLFNEIKKVYCGFGGIFDSITSDDIIFAFFPCTYFCENNVMFFSGTSRNYSKNCTQKQKLDLIITRSIKRQEFYEVLLKLVSICEERGLRLVLENPYSKNHYLVNNFPYKPALIDRNRRQRGDFFMKPTQYYFINCKPTVQCSPCFEKNIKIVHKEKYGIERSLISAEYAKNFICDFILGKEQNNTLKTLF